MNDMKELTKITAAALAALTLAACATDEKMSRSEPVAIRDAGSAAETACKVALNKNYGGKAGEIVVTSSEFSQANSIVMMQAGPETWKCLVSNNGKVQELNVVGTR